MMHLLFVHLFILCTLAYFPAQAMHGTHDPQQEFARGRCLLASQQKNLQEAGFDMLQPLANQGYIPAQYACGIALLTHPELTSDRLFFEQEPRDQGVCYLIRATQKGDKRAKSSLAHYLFGPEAQSMLAKPAHTYANNSRLAHALAAGCSILPPLPQKQIKKEPVDKPCKHQWALNLALKLTWQGRTVPGGLKNLATLADAPHNCPHACLALGTLLLIGKSYKPPRTETAHDTEIRLSNGRTYLKKAAYEDQSPQEIQDIAHFNLAYCADAGLGRPADSDRALDFYSHAGKLPSALYNKALLLDSGRCTLHARNTQEIITLLKQACRQGHCKAPGYLACVLEEEGRRVETERGYEAAQEWYQQADQYYDQAATTNNDPVAYGNWGNMLYQLAKKTNNPKEQELKKCCAIRAWKKGAFLGDSVSFTNWGCSMSEQAEQMDDSEEKDQKMLCAIQLLTNGLQRGDCKPFYLGLHALRIATAYRTLAPTLPAAEKESALHRAATNQEHALFFFNEAVRKGHPRAQEYCEQLEKQEKNWPLRLEAGIGGIENND